MKGRRYSKGFLIACFGFASIFVWAHDAQAASSQEKNRGVIFGSKEKKGLSDDALQALQLRKALETNYQNMLPASLGPAQAPDALAALKTALTLKEKELGASDQAFEDAAKQADDLRFELELKNRALAASYLAAEQAKKDLDDSKKAAKSKSLLQDRYALDSPGGKYALPRDKELETRKLNLTIKLRESEKLKNESLALKASLNSKNSELLELKKEKRKAERQIEQLRRVSREKEAIEKEKESLAKDNSQLRREKVDLKVELLKLKRTDTSEKQVLALKKEKEEMRLRLRDLEAKSKQEKAKLHQDLGTAYTQARIFDLAIEEYEKSLIYDPANAQIHYNIGLLYAHAKNDYKKAYAYLKKYLELNPVAQNRDEVKYLMKIMQK